MSTTSVTSSSNPLPARRTLVLSILQFQLSASV
jgi:hypothetical protein